MIRWLIALLVLTSSAQAAEHDLVIYGGTSAAVTSAVQAKRMGKTVVIVCRTNIWEASRRAAWDSRTLATRP